MFQYTFCRGLLILVWLAVLLILPVQAIVIRHDVADKHYLASIADYPALATFYVDGAHGSLIAPRWVLTAAHTTFCLQPGSLIRLGSALYPVRRLYVHPEHQPGVSHDIALVELTTEVPDITPVQLYAKTDEAGQDLWFIGAGGTGDGKRGLTIDNVANRGQLRKAQNKVSKAAGPLLDFVFDQGEAALPLEGISGGGDSGGPAFLRHNQQFWLLGLSSRGANDHGSFYGGREVYSRVSFFLPWIEQVMQQTGPLKPVTLVPATLALPQLRRWPDGVTADNITQICQEISLTAKP